MSDTQSDATDQQQPGEGDAQQEQGQEKAPTFTQADVDRIVRERVQRERAKFADYDDLKTKAGEAKTAEDRLTDLEKQLEQSQREALRRRVQAAHGIADEDADLFLTGADEDTLTAQAKRLIERESSKKRSNHVPAEGSNPRPAADESRETVRGLFRGD
nr:MAG TPA_asm: Major head protein [Caudoviricetes sp.]